MSKVKVRHILVQHEYQAKDVLRSLSLGEEFSLLARKFSLCSSAAGGGNLGLVAKSRLDDQFVEAIDLLEAYQVSPPVRTKFGWHIIQKLTI